MKSNSLFTTLLKTMTLGCAFFALSLPCSADNTAATQNFAQLAYQESIQGPPATPVDSNPVSIIPHPLYQQPGTTTAGQTVITQPSVNQRDARLVPMSSPFTPSSTAPNPLPAASFLGLADSNAHNPPDTQGAVGPNYTMSVTNDQIAMKSRTTGLTTIATLQGFWAPVSSGDPFNATGAFDPRVVYDPYSQRWMFVCGFDYPLDKYVGIESGIVLGVSQSSDPTGNWYEYRMKVSSAFGNNNNWADHPAVGFNHNWIVVSVNMFPLGNNPTSAAALVYAFDKTKLYSGIQSVTTKKATSQDLIPVTTFDDTPSLPLYLVQTWSGNSGGRGYLHIGKISGPIGSESLNETSATTSSTYTALIHGTPILRGRQTQNLISRPNTHLLA